MAKRDIGDIVRVPPRKIIDNNDIESTPDQKMRGIRSDITRPTRHQNFRHKHLVYGLLDGTHLAGAFPNPLNWARMEKTFEAVYEHGVLRPLEALRLPDNAHVMVTIADVASNGYELADYFTAEEWAAAANDQISLNEVRQALSSIPGSLADTVAASREDR